MRSGRAVLHDRGKSALGWLVDDRTGHGEGRMYLGSTTVTTDATGAAGTTVPPIRPGVGRKVVATATPLQGGLPQSTSEFSPCVTAP